MTMARSSMFEYYAAVGYAVYLSPLPGGDSNGLGYPVWSRGSAGSSPARPTEGLVVTNGRTSRLHREDQGSNPCGSTLQKSNKKVLAFHC